MRLRVEDYSYDEVLKLAHNIRLMMSAFDTGRLDGYKDIRREDVDEKTVEYYIGNDRVAHLNRYESTLWSMLMQKHGTIKHNSFAAHTMFVIDAVVHERKLDDPMFTVSEEQFFYNTLQYPNNTVPARGIIFGVLNEHTFDYNEITLKFKLHLDKMLAYSQEVMHNAM